MKLSTKKRFEENKKNMSFYDQDGTKRPKFQNHEKRPQFKRREKIRPVSYTYTSEMPDVAFFDVLTIMADNCKMISTFIETCAADKERMFNDYDYTMKTLAQAAIESCPQLIAKKNIHSMLSISANKIHIRLESGIAFALETKYEIIEKVAHIVSCTGTITLYNKNDNLVNDLLNNGFKLVERTR